MKKILFILLVALMITYTLWIVLFGKHGFIALKSYKQEYKLAKQEKILLEQQKQKLEQKVERLRSKSIDPDMVDEQARKSLGYARKGEKVYIE